ncbi:hypothetical protein LEN26_011981, partial [Aphanomyces euteiches]
RIPAYEYARIPFIQLFQTTTSQNSAFSEAVDDGLSGQILPYIICPFYKIKPRWTFKLPFTQFQAILEWTHPSHIGRGTIENFTCEMRTETVPKKNATDIELLHHALGLP